MCTGQNRSEGAATRIEEVKVDAIKHSRFANAGLESEFKDVRSERCRRVQNRQKALSSTPPHADRYLSELTDNIWPEDTWSIGLSKMRSGSERAKDKVPPEELLRMPYYRGLSAEELTSFAATDFHGTLDDFTWTNCCDTTTSEGWPQNRPSIWGLGLPFRSMAAFGNRDYHHPPLPMSSFHHPPLPMSSFQSPWDDPRLRTDALGLFPPPIPPTQHKLWRPAPRYPKEYQTKEFRAGLNGKIPRKNPNEEKHKFSARECSINCPCRKQRFSQPRFLGGQDPSFDKIPSKTCDGLTELLGTMANVIFKDSFKPFKSLLKLTTWKKTANKPISEQFVSQTSVNKGTGELRGIRRLSETSVDHKPFKKKVTIQTPSEEELSVANSSTMQPRHESQNKTANFSDLSLQKNLLSDQPLPYPNEAPSEHKDGPVHQGYLYNGATFPSDIYPHQTNAFAHTLGIPEATHTCGGNFPCNPCIEFYNQNACLRNSIIAAALDPTKLCPLEPNCAVPNCSALYQFNQHGYDSRFGSASTSPSFSPQLHHGFQSQHSYFRDNPYQGYDSSSTPASPQSPSNYYSAGFQTELHRTRKHLPDEEFVFQNSPVTISSPEPSRSLGPTLNSIGAAFTPFSATKIASAELQQRTPSKTSLSNFNALGPSDSTIRLFQWRNMSVNRPSDNLFKWEETGFNKDSRNRWFRQQQTSGERSSNAAGITLKSSNKMSSKQIPSNHEIPPDSVGVIHQGAPLGLECIRGVDPSVFYKPWENFVPATSPTIHDESPPPLGRPLTLYSSWGFKPRILEKDRRRSSPQLSRKFHRHMEGDCCRHTVFGGRDCPSDTESFCDLRRKHRTYTGSRRIPHPVHGFDDCCQGDHVCYGRHSPTSSISDTCYGAYSDTDEYIEYPHRTRHDHGRCSSRSHYRCRH
ncbi:unnamed protein product [Cyprideis torosa]|uniref:Uncharacterized protein n=1 Tax=Cyprideis torosa TaxID=163714 RepID=A0A7R8WJU3_9CRUS|nr:unnamed protein product [Cyprideis torosa]CAG0900581.1 unnamed protein product [Cyprideis torosa]